jgi:hypothetical protein
MNLKNQPPVFVPRQHCAEIEKLSKAALMDMVWDLATRCAGTSMAEPDRIMTEVRTTAEIVTRYRKEEARRQGRSQ